MAIYRQLGPKKQYYYTHQIDIKHQKLLTISRHHLKLQAFSINNPNPLLKQQYRKKKNHSRANVRALTGAEINKRE